MVKRRRRIKARDKVLKDLAPVVDGKTLTDEQTEEYLVLAADLMLRGYDVHELALNLKVGILLAKKFYKRIEARWGAETRFMRGGKQQRGKLLKRLDLAYRELWKIVDDTGVSAKQKIAGIKAVLETINKQAQMLGIVGVPGSSIVNVGEIHVKRFNEASDFLIKAIGGVLRDELDDVTLGRVLRRIADVATSEGMQRTLVELHSLDNLGDVPALPGEVLDVDEVD